jgi:N-acetylmuramoyl-L-alanine amidase
LKASADTRESFIYENPGFLIVTHPEVRFRTTTAENMSLLGAANPEYPLYINGEEYSTTPRGFFSAYKELETGENVFVIENGEDSETLIITRNEPGEWFPPRTEYFTHLQYGSTENTYITRFADLNDDLYMRTPLARGTTFRILAEHGDFYIIEDGTAVLQSNVYMLDYIRAPVRVINEVVTEHERGVDVSYTVNDYPLYEIELNGSTALLTIYAAETIEREFTFPERVTGFEVNFHGNTMNIRFRYPPKSLSEAVVLLDAGHGGSDPGALGPPSEFGPMEKHFNLYVARGARDYLEALGVTVVMIRDEDSRIDIFDRIDFFDEVRPDFAVSVHANSMPLSSDFSSAQGPLMFYVMDLSEQAADTVIRRIAAETGNEYNETSARRQNFAMARYTGAPSMLFEMGFLCNPEEYEIMLDTDYLDRMSAALARGIVEQLSMNNELLTTEPEPEPEPEPSVTTPEQEAAIAVMAGIDAENRQSGSMETDSIINLFAAVIIGLLFIGAALLLPNREALMKRK